MKSKKQSVLCYDGITRTGHPVYIHPDGIYRVFEFTGRMGTFREAILTDRSTPARRKSKKFTADEDKIVMNLSVTEAAKKLGRKTGSVSARRKKLEGLNAKST